MNVSNNYKDVLLQWREAKDKTEIESVIFCRGPYHYRSLTLESKYIDLTKSVANQLEKDFNNTYGVFSNFLLRYAVAQKRHPFLASLEVDSIFSITDTLLDAVDAATHLKYEQKKFLISEVAEKIIPSIIPDTTGLMIDFNWNNKKNYRIPAMVEGALNALPVFYATVFDKEERGVFIKTRNKQIDVKQLEELYHNVEDLAEKKVKLNETISRWFEEQVRNDGATGAAD